MATCAELADSPGRSSGEIEGLKQVQAEADPVGWLTSPL
jgi:hypothetical protein